MAALRGSGLPRLAAVLGMAAVLAGTNGVLASSPGTDVRLSNDDPGLSGYTSADDLAGLTHYSDATLDECSVSRGRQNEPALAIDPRNSQVMVGSSNDYCGVYNDGNDSNGAPIASGPIWLGYYRSENAGASFQSSLVPGYPGDMSQLGALAAIRTTSSGDPVLAWDAEGRLFVGSEASGSDLPNANFGDEWVARYVNPGGASGNSLNDGKQFAGSTIVETGGAAKNLQGKFNDKTSIEADRTDTSCRGNVYFAWSRFNGLGVASIYFSRSTDHGVTWSNPMKLSETVKDVQFPEISITGNGNVYVTYRQYAAGHQADAINLVGSTDCGATFGRSKTIQAITAMDLSDVKTSGASARDCGDGPEACLSGYTFFRGDTGVRATADQADTTHQWIYLLYEAIVPGSEVATGTTFGWEGSGTGGQSAIYYLRYDASTGSVSSPERIASVTDGQQLYPDLAVDAGVIHALWWDSRNDPNNDATSMKVRPIGNDASGNVAAALDVYAATRPISGGAWSAASRLTDTTSNLQWEQFANRTVPFAGDYLWIDSKGGTTFGVWTDGRNTVEGTGANADGRYPDGHTGTDVWQCRTLVNGAWTGDTCPRAGGLDQNIYGDLAP